MAANGEQLAQVARWNDAVLAGELVAPRVLAAGIPVNGRSPGAVGRRVEQAATARADFIKVFSAVAAPSWRAIAATARAHALPVAGHAPASIALLAAARDGLRSNEHLSQVYEACSSVEGELLAARPGLDATQLVLVRDAQEQRALDAHDRRTCSRVAAALAEMAQAQVPTLVLPYFEAHPGPTALRADARWSSLRADEQARWLRILATPASAESAALARRRWQVSRAIVATLHRAGVPLLAGTDAPMPRIYPGHSLHDELALLVEAGLSPAEALRAATLAPARYLGVAADAGSVATGKRADLVVLDADPLQDIRNTRRVHAVVLAGRALRPDDLDPARASR